MLCLWRKFRVWCSASGAILGFRALPLCSASLVPFFSSNYKHGKREWKRTTGAAKGSERERGKLGSSALSLLCKSCALLLLFNIQTWEEGDEENDRCSEGK